MSDDPWNINPSKKKEIRERIEKKAKERSEKTFFQKYGNFLGILLFAFVMVSLRTENGRCTILPFIFSEQCSTDSSIAKDSPSINNNLYDKFIKENDYIESKDQDFENRSLNDIGKTQDDVFDELASDLARSNFFEINKEITPLTNIPEDKYLNPEVFLSILGRCSAIQMVDFYFDEPNPDKRFEQRNNDMGFFMKKMLPATDILSESEISSMIGLKSVLTYEYFLNRYEEISGSNLITEDREFCSLFKKLL